MPGGNKSSYALKQTLFVCVSTCGFLLPLSIKGLKKVISFLNAQSKFSHLLI